MFKQSIIKAIERLVRSTLAAYGLEIRRISPTMAVDLGNIKCAIFLRMLESISNWDNKYFFFSSYCIDEQNQNYTMKDLLPKDFQRLQTLLSEINIEPYSLNASHGRVEIDQYKKVHYACGQNILPGWLNIDAYDSETMNYHRMNLLDAHPFPSEMFDFAFSEDFLEHLKQSDSIIFLSEAYRTLRNGGVLRLSFPGLEGVLKKHYGKDNTAWRGAVEAYAVWEHEHFYSVEELALVAKNVGFRDVEIVEFGQSKHKDLQYLDSRKDQVGLNTYVELRK